MDQNGQKQNSSSESQENPGLEKRRKLKGFWYSIFIIFTLAGVLLAGLNVFQIRLFGLTLMENSHLYTLLALFLSPLFILIPASKKGSLKKVVWYDVLLFFLSLTVFLYLAIRGYDIQTKGFLFMTPFHIIILSMVAIVLVLEATRRAGGFSLFVICVIFVTFPLYAPYMPGFLEGHGLSLKNTITYHVLDYNSLLGIPIGVFGKLLCGFLVFGVAIASLGGGKFFLDLSFALLGTYRGGPAKVAVIASSIFGTMSGSAVSNVVTVGSMTIPAMKKAGYPSYYAAAIEACSSTGGMIMPPVMGVVAFIMAEMLNIPYYQIAIAAFLPACLYYLGLFIQVDSFAAKNRIQGLNRSEIPSVLKTLKEGWFYSLAILALIYFLYLRLEAQAAFYATGVLLVLAMWRKETRLDLKRTLQFVQSIGETLVDLVAMLAGVGFIIGSFSITGLGGSLATEIVSLAGDSLAWMLIIGAAASYILGLGLTATACYIFLAIVLAPGLVNQGLNLIAVHLFILYWGVLSDITPPVALSVFTASGIAGSDFFRTGMQAMRLAVVIYFIPFFFVLSPALVFQGSFFEILHVFSTCVLGVILIGGGMEGYLLGLGEVKWPLNVLAIVAGAFLAIPGWKTDLLGFGIIGVFALYKLFVRNRRKRGLT